jgi:hypothetical protein
MFFHLQVVLLPKRMLGINNLKKGIPMETKDKIVIYPDEMIIRFDELGRIVCIYVDNKILVEKIKSDEKKCQ